jgi:hypothetical protein
MTPLRARPGSWPFWAQLGTSLLISCALLCLLGAIFGFGPQMVKR